jgi:hypothetical protein
MMDWPNYIAGVGSGMCVILPILVWQLQRQGALVDRLLSPIATVKPIQSSAPKRFIQSTGSVEVEPKAAPDNQDESQEEIGSIKIDPVVYAELTESVERGIKDYLQ